MTAGKSITALASLNSIESKKLIKKVIGKRLDNSEELVTRLDTAIRHTKKADWKNNRFKFRDVENAVKEELGDYKVDVKDVMERIKNQP